VTAGSSAVEALVEWEVREPPPRVVSGAALSAETGAAETGAAEESTP